MSGEMQHGRRRIAAIVAHPDDEVLGCGGTLRRHVIAGDDIFIFIMADGEKSREPNPGMQAIVRREAAARTAADILGIKKLEMHRFPDNRMDTVPLLEIVKVIEPYVREIAPEIVYTHHAGDLNIDHRRVHEAVVTACRPQPDQPVRTLLFFETISSTEWQPPPSGEIFSPNWFADITGTLDCKIRALHAYHNEMHPWPHPRSYQGVQHLAHWRGAMVGWLAAEAFMLGRHLQS